VNALRATAEEGRAALDAEGIRTRPGRLAPACLAVLGERPNVLGLAAHRGGILEVQDEGSQLAGLAAGASPGDTVLDLCAGAGGKTLLLAAAVGPGCRVHACDVDGERLGRLRTRAARAGAAGIVAVHGAAPPEGLLADRVLVDAPCSELGPLRRGPDLRWRLDPAPFSGLPALQEGLLARAARHVRPGGRLAYVTCTFRREEDEDVAAAFEAAHPEFRRVAALDAGALAPGADLASLVGPDLFLRTFPHRHGTDGFFAAAWAREG
jgi:16S rRNA (cytosine967-C5)-methyltransferase